MPEPELDPGSADWHGRTRRPPPAGAGSVVNRCGGGWSAVAYAPSAPVTFLQVAQRRSTGRGRGPGAGTPRATNRQGSRARCARTCAVQAGPASGGLPTNGGRLAALRLVSASSGDK